MDSSVTTGRGYLYEPLCKSIGQVVTICTDACCFTGVLCSMSSETVKLVTKNNGCPGNNYYGKLTIIPCCEIIAVTLCNNSV